MSDQIRLRIGAEPWLPTDAAKIKKVLNHHDIPLAGIIQQHRKCYLFECLDGHTNTLSLWAYAEITSAERRQLLKARGADELQRLCGEILTSRPFTAAVAIDFKVELAAIAETQRAPAPPPAKAATKAITRKADSVRAVQELATC